jgi:hypothetical protein
MINLTDGYEREKNPALCFINRDVKIGLGWDGTFNLRMNVYSKDKH